MGLRCNNLTCQLAGMHVSGCQAYKLPDRQLISEHGAFNVITDLDRQGVRRVYVTWPGAKMRFTLEQAAQYLSQLRAAVEYGLERERASGTPD